MRSFYIITGDTLARYDASDPTAAAVEWDTPGLLLELVTAGCPLADVDGTGECIELHLYDDTDGTASLHVMAMQPGPPDAVELTGEALGIALQAMLDA